MNEPATPSASEPGDFARALLPHRDCAYNLARWLMRNEPDAQDCVQDAYLKAFRAFGRFRGGDGRSWLLTIVRNVCYSKLRQTRREPLSPFDETVHSSPYESSGSPSLWKHALAQEMLPKALEELPAEAREIIVLHEIEGMSYREIASVMEVPIGTVMSRLSRARQKLQTSLQGFLQKDAAYGL